METNQDRTGIIISIRKPVVMILAALMVFMFCIDRAYADPEEMRGKEFPDFSVRTINGDVFTLSESLKTHDLVLINFWATWCGPCCLEFPILETAWEQYSDRVDVIALSIDTTETVDQLKEFAQDYRLWFPIGCDENGLFDEIQGYAIPTTLIVNRDMRVVAVEIGAKTSVQEFTELFDSLLSAIPAQECASGRCVIRFRDTAGNPVPGVTVGFCNGEYTPVETGYDGRVVFDGNLSEYHVHLLDVPDGYVKPWEQLYIEGDEFDATFTLRPVPDLFRQA